MKETITVIAMLLFLTFTVKAQNWSVNGNSTFEDGSSKVVVDSNGNVYMAGYFSGYIKFDTVTLYAEGSTDFFIVKYSPIGKVQWARSGGSVGDDKITDILVDGLGNVYATGRYGAHLPVSYPYNDTLYISPGKVTSRGGEDIFLLKTDWSGNLQWLKSFGSKYDDYATAISCNATTNVIFIAGGFCEYGGSPPVYDTILFDGIMLKSYGDGDIFICSIDTTGAVIWAKNYGEKSHEYASDVVVDSLGFIYLTGDYPYNLNFDGNKIVSNSTGFVVGNVFIAKFDSLCQNIWVKTNGGSNAGTSSGGFVRSVGLVLSGEKDVYVSGSYFHCSVNLSDGSGLAYDDQGKTFYLRYDSNGSIIWAKKSSGIGNMSGTDIWVSEDSIIFSTGVFHDDIAFGNVHVYSNGAEDAYIVKLDKNGNYLSAINVGGSSTDYGSSITGDKKGNLYSCGNFKSSTLNFDTQSLINTGDFDFYLVQLPPTITGFQKISGLTKLTWIIPNPNNGSFRIRMGREDYEQVQVIDGMGRTVYRQNLPLDREVIDVHTGLTDGIYLVQLRGKAGVITKKMIVNK